MRASRSVSADADSIASLSSSGERPGRRASSSSVFRSETHRLEGAGPEGPVDLLAEVPHVDVNDVRAVLVGEVPRVLEQLEPAQHLARAAHERLEESELLRRQLELVLASPRATRRRVEPQVADLERGRPFHASSPRKCPQAREQLGERERFREVVVGAGVEA
jgi:hypothetical protein